MGQPISPEDFECMGYHVSEEDALFFKNIQLGTYVIWFGLTMSVLFYSIF